MGNSKSNSLLQKSFIYAIGTFGSKVLAFLLVPIYSYYLNQDEFGYFDIVITGINLLVPFLTLQISDSVFRWLLTNKDERERENIITNSLILLLFNVVITSLLSFFLFLVYPLRGQFLVTLVCCSAMVYPYMQQVARGVGKNKLFAFSGLLYTITYLLCNIFFLIYLGLKLEALFYSNILAYVIGSLFLFWRVKLSIFIKFRCFDFLYIKSLLSYSLPLVPNTISWWLINSASKYIILIFIGVSANGIYAMAGRFPVILVMVNQVFTLAWQEKAIVDHQKKVDKKSYKKILQNLIKIQFSLVAVLSLGSQFMVDFLLSKDYYESWLYMPLLYVSVAFLSFSGFYGAFYLGANKTKEVFLTTIVGGIVNVVLALLLVKLIGLWGIAIASAIGYITLFIIRIKSTKKIIKLNFPWKICIKYGVLLIVSLFVTYIQNEIYSLSFLVLIVLLLIVDNKLLIKSLIERIEIKSITNR
ncbi:oligosaccharide flippase family protein [Zhouia spongiae]|uniref:Oligosaccharide flippase family protein n=1 Tax=Zhouia spongiae TaxID=2202721 RepID=A0ABY3YJ73_9FLAO|nr:oligosaccharide flippase family protein [Zhouia spongiae]UNY97882.1 oligosaccharide flippase family protein [Zhouia spongiae]